MERAKRVYRTNWNLEDKRDIDKSLFDIFQNSIKSTINFRNKELFFQYAMLLYISGRRRIEPFLMPVTVSQTTINEREYFTVKVTNAKHFVGYARKCKICGEIFKSGAKWKEHQSSTGHQGYTHWANRTYIEQTWIANNPFEYAMFLYLLKGRHRVTIDFKPLLPSSYQNKDNIDDINYKDLISITERFKRVFGKINITDGKKILQNDSIVPHMLRHMRVYDLIVIHNYPPTMVQHLIGWDSIDMVEYYTDIKNQMKNKEMIAQYERMPMSNDWMFKQV